MKNSKAIILIVIVVTFIRCANPFFVSENKWKDMHDVTINSNESNVQISNKYGESFGFLKKGENTLTIDVLKKYNKTLTFTHPNRKDTTIILKRKVRGGALFFDFLIFYPSIVYDFATADMYKLKRSSKVINLNLQYTYNFYEIEYKLLKNTNNPNDLMNYISKYPDSPFKEKAQKKMYDLAYLNSRSLNTINDYEKHNNEYPESPYKSEIQTKIYDMAYNDAIMKNTAAAFEEYITKYPNSPKIEEAKQSKIKIKEIEEAYSTAKKTNTYSGYKKFMDSYEQSKFHNEIAKTMLNVFCTEKSNELKNLQEINDALKYVKETQNKFSVNSDNEYKLENLRDVYIADEIKKCKTKSDYFSLLINQYNNENNIKDGSEYNVISIVNRIISNKSNMNGTYNFWQSNGTKETYTFSNGFKNGAYIKTSEDEKITLEKGNFLNGNKDGVYIINYESGKKHYEQNFTNGSLVKETEFDENGKNLTFIREEEARKAEEIRKENERIREVEKNNQKKLFYASLKEKTINFIINRLKSPSTASVIFYYEPDKAAEMLNKAGHWLPKCDEVCATMLTVDAQNGFGAYLRTTYVLFFKDTKPCHLEDVRSLDQAAAEMSTIGEMRQMLSFTLTMNGCNCNK